MRRNEFRYDGNYVLLFHGASTHKRGLRQIDSHYTRAMLIKGRALGICCCGKKYSDYQQLIHCQWFHDCACKEGGHVHD